MNRFILLIFYILLFSANDMYAEADKCQRSTEGKDFWFGFMEGRNDHNNEHYIEITVTAREATNFTVTLGKASTAYFTGNVAANSSVQIKIEPRTLGQAVGSETIQDRAIHLVSEKPVNVYALNWDYNSADVAVIYPVESLGTSYFAMCYTPYVHTRPEHAKNSEFLVVAAEDSTKVTITPSVVTDNGKPAGVSYRIVLNKGEVYQVQSLNSRDLYGQGDLTGSYIQSDKPVAFYSGNFSTTIPAVAGSSGYDHLYEQIPPISTWGREFYTVPLYGRNADRYRIMASDDNTSVLVGTQLYQINRGKFIEITLSGSSPSRIYADKAIMVAQFSQANTTDNGGDPFMIILGPVSQSKNDVTFVAYTSSQIRTYYVNIVALTSEKDNIELDGNLIGSQFHAYAGTKYSYAQLSISSSATHRLRNLNPEMGFLAYVYGYGGYESYGYGVGFNLDLVLDLGQSIDFEGDTLPVCKGSSVALDAGSHFDYYHWNTGDTTQKITVTKGGLYWAQGTTIDGCVQRDSIYIVEGGLIKPNIGNDKSGCSPYSTLLDAGSGFKKYEWNTGASTQTTSVNATGTYSVSVTDHYGCQTRDTMKMTVFQVPVITMAGEELTCGKMFRKLVLQFSNANENMLANGKMVWNTDQPGKLKFTNSTNISTDITVTDWDIYDISFTFTTPDGCVVSGSYTLHFAEIPTSEIEFVDNPNDKCKGYSREIIYKGNGTQNANYFWDYGNCLADSIDWNKRRVSVAAGNAKSVISLYVEENGCWSIDTSTLTMGANPAFVMNTAKSRGCDTATVQFSGELKIDDNLLFEWNFGDGNSVSGIQKPRHFYSDTGKYDITLKITNLDNQCFVGYTENEMVKIFPTPVAKTDIDPGFCNNPEFAAIYTLNNDSSFCTWAFDGAKQIGTGNDTITIQFEKPTANIRLQVDEFGCKSKWIETTAKRIPVFDFEADTIAGCQPMQAFLRAFSSDEQLEYTWLTDSAKYPISEQLFTLPNPGKYDFSVSAKSIFTQCSDTLSKSDLIEVHPKPMAQFTVDYPVAILEHANLQFTNETSDADFYAWDFGDNTFSSEENPQHTYTALAKFTTLLQVETENGCRDTTSMEIEILPFNVFTPNAFRPDSDFPENREFMPVGSGVDPSDFKLQVYNRWGELIFESNHPDSKWDGTTKNNTPAPMGNYVWRTEFSDIQGFHHEMKGQIMLVR